MTWDVFDFGKLTDRYATTRLRSAIISLIGKGLSQFRPYGRKRQA
jgi:hypothetical protein